MSAPFSSASHTAPRTALVTGAGKRLGREIALGLARAGWRVAVHFRSSEAEALQTAADCMLAFTQSQAPSGLKAEGADTAKAPMANTNTQFQGQDFIFKADLANEDAARQLLPQVVDKLGRVDAVINSAALFEHDDVQSFSYTNMAQHWASNTGAAIVLAQALHQHCQSRGAQAAEAVVVNMLDQKLWNPNPDFLSYTLSKAALEAANTLLAQALAPLVRVVGVAPGLTLTSHMLDDDKFQKLHALSPLGSSSSVEDVVSSVVFAVHNRAMTGTTLLVDGGQHLMKFERDFSLM
jgi:NAD(P)-dependent dehydrogenase (short-subunit alcohol dehydrogenase family)